jgi:uncharacterized protein
MRLDDEAESINFEDRTGDRSGSGGFGFPGGGGGMQMGRSMGCGSLIIVILGALLFNVDLSGVLGGGQQVGQQPQQTQRSAPQGQSQLDPSVKEMVRKVLGSTERRWTDIFAKEGLQYSPTTLVFYKDRVQSGCGSATSDAGPFYCPADKQIYLDVGFFQEMSNRFGASGDFAAAYVIAHEVGHHIQNITGLAAKVRQAQSGVSQTQGNQLQVRMELQADCYAGVWAANDTNLLESGDVEEGLRAAHQIGDDVLQKQAQGFAVESSFTHGSAAQRMEALKRGLTTGDQAQCDVYFQ